MIPPRIMYDKQALAFLANVGRCPTLGGSGGFAVDEIPGAPP